MKRLCNIQLAVALTLTLTLGACGSSGNSGNSGSSGNQTPQIATDSSSMVVNFPILESAKLSYDTINMGRIAQGDVVEGEFTVRNNTAQPLVIIDVITGCGCTTTQYDPKPIAPNQSRNITYRFESKTFIGQQFKSIEIIASDRSIATVYLSGQIFTPETD